MRCSAEWWAINTVVKNRKRDNLWFKSHNGITHDSGSILLVSIFVGDSSSELSAVLSSALSVVFSFLFLKSTKWLVEPFCCQMSQRHKEGKMMRIFKM